MIAAKIKRLVKNVAPKRALRGFHRIQRALQQAHNAKLTPEQVFSEIYRQGKWGGKGTTQFHSGAGSATQSIVEPYVAAITGFLASLPEGSRRVVDLGCGDFGVGKRLLPVCSSYVGVDVVPDLIRHHQATFIDAKVEFRCSDIIDGELPAGDVCLIRQVFQHLSNAQIAKVLAKLPRYRTVFITEHYPADDVAVVPNKDKVHGGDIRLYDDSAVYVDRPPFNFSPTRKELFLEVPDHGFNDLFKSGVIRTFKFDFG
jgi:SAM-dependent methyltransferase